MIDIIPAPREVVMGKEKIPLFSNQATTSIVLPNNPPKAIKFGADYLNKALKALSGREASLSDSGKGGTRIIVATKDDPTVKMIVESVPLLSKEASAEGYAIRMIKDGERWNIYAVGCSARGALYALETLSQLLIKEGNDLFLASADIVDWPSFAVRDFNRDGYDALIDAPALAEWALKYKVNVVGICHFWPWRNVPEEYWKNAKTVFNLARETGAFDAMFYCNPYAEYHKETQIDLLNKSDVDLFLNHIRTALDAGATKVMVCVDDFTVWKKFTAEEKGKFGNLETAQAHLMNLVYKEIRKDYPRIEFYFCPAGPQGGYAGVPKAGSVQEKTLRQLAESIPEDVAIVWTGPTVRSRSIRSAEIDLWIKAAKGRKPFLWDNTIYAHYQPTFVATFLNPFKNDFPVDLPSRLNRGIHINGANAGSEIVKLSLLTAADYLWNAEGYNAGESLKKAMAATAGASSVSSLLHFRDDALAAIKAAKAKQAQAPELKAKALETLKSLSATTSNAKLALDLEKFLDGQMKE